MCNQGVFFVQTDLFCLNANCLGHQVSMISRLTYSIVLDCNFSSFLFCCCWILFCNSLNSVGIHFFAFVEDLSRTDMVAATLNFHGYCCPGVLEYWTKMTSVASPVSQTKQKRAPTTRKSAGGKQRTLFLWPSFSPLLSSCGWAGPSRLGGQEPDTVVARLVAGHGEEKKSCIVGLVQHWVL